MGTTLLVWDRFSIGKGQIFGWSEPDSRLAWVRFWVCLGPILNDSGPMFYVSGPDLGMFLGLFWVNFGQFLRLL